MSDTPQAKRSPWVYVGFGCLAAVVLSCAIGGIGVWMVGRAGKNFAEEMNDPTRREAKAKKAALEAMGALPEGYYPVFSFGIPLVMDMVVLSDHQPPEDGGLQLDGNDRNLLYVRVIEADDSKKVRDYFEGKDDDPTVLRNKGINIDPKESLGHGEVTVSGQKVFWVAQRGKVMTQGRGGDRQGLSTSFLFDCPADGKQRLALWFSKDPDPNTPAAQLDVTGTVVDPGEMQKLLAPLKPCGR